MANSLRSVGNVEASSTVDVRSQVTGELVSIEFKEGDDVTAGQLLFTIDPRPFQIVLDQAEAALAKDTAQAQNARTAADRAVSLFDRGLIAPADRDTATANASSLDATVKADAAQVANAKLQLQYTKIAAPVAGRTGALLIHTGALVHSTDTNPLVTINQIEPVYVSFSMPSQQLAMIRQANAGHPLAVSANVPGAAGDAAEGTLTFIDNVVDTSTDTIRLKATFPNRDRRLWAGQFVEIGLQISVDQNAIVAPAAAIIPGQQGSLVYVVKPDQTVEARQVVVARTVGQESVIESGLRAGETVVTDGQLQLNPGTRVSVKPPVDRGKM
jgi:multidrug efflux system membrane fusion protein